MLDNIIDEIKQAIVDFFISTWKKFKYIIVGILILTFIFLIVYLKKDTPDNIETQEIYFLEITISNWATWITLITVPITAIWAVFQYKKNTRTRQQERGAEIAKLFSKELALKCSILGAVIEISKLKKLLKLDKIDFTKLERFDIDEIRDLYKNDRIDDEFRIIVNSEETQNIYLYILESRISLKRIDQIIYLDHDVLHEKMKKIMKEKYSEIEIENLENKNLLEVEFKKFYKFNNQNENEEKFYKKQYTDEEAKAIFILDNKELPFNFTQLINDLLNELEYICMYISSQSAGSEFVFQSLHQIFLKTVKQLAIEIGTANTNYTDKYFTNIIHVYKEWNKMVEKNSKKEKKNKKKAYRYLEPKVSKI